MQQFSVAARIYIWTVCGLGIAAVVCAGIFFPLPSRSWPLTAIGISLAVAAGFRKVLLFAVRRRDKESPSRATMSLGFIPAYLLLLAAGPLAGVVAAGLNALVTTIHPRRAHGYQIAFSISAVVVSAFASAMTLQTMGFYQHPLKINELFSLSGNANLPVIVSSFVLSTVIYWLLNTSLIATVIALTSKQSPLKIWLGSFLWMGPGYFAGASCAMVVYTLSPLIYEHPWAIAGILLVGIPLPVVIFLVYKSHNDRAEDQEKHIEALNHSHTELELAYTNLADANQELQNSKEDLQNLYTSTVESLALAIDAKDRYTKEHIQRVKGLAVSIAKVVGLTGNDLKALETAALLHDIGKIAIPEHILNKPGRLTPEEFERVKCHPDMGAKILQPVPFPFPVMPAVRSHHEKWDGSGYPDGLRGEAIPLGGRILSVADVYDALTTDRAYRAGWPHDEAVQYLKDNAGSHFDPAIVSAFLTVLERSPRLHIGSDITGTRDAGKNGFPSSAAAAIHEAVAANLNRSSFEYVTLYEVGQVAADNLSMGEMLDVFAGKFKAIWSASACAIALLEKEVLTIERAVGTNAAFLVGLQTFLGEGPTGQVAASGTGVMDEEAAREMQAAYQSQRCRGVSATAPSEGEDWTAFGSAMVVPLVSDGIVIGTAALYQERVGVFDREYLRVFASAASQAARTIARTREYDRNRLSALTDSLTGLYNARHLSLFLDKELERARTEDRPLTVLVLDLDNFKPVNDQFGHTRGNEVLRDLGAVFQSVLRSGDLVARYAGDEFVVILPSVGQTEAKIVMDKIRDAVAAYDPTQSGPPLGNVRVGVSLGAASFPYDGAEATTLISCADRAMYHDKNFRKAAQGRVNGDNSNNTAGTPAETEDKSLVPEMARAA